MARQLSFDLPARRALGREDFFVSPANAMAVALIDLWPDWISGKLVLSGPEGSGKTHLAHVWADAAGARILPARDLPRADIPALASGNVAIEDVPRIVGEAEAETALFHLHNLALAQGGRLLMTGRGEPGRWGLRLPDLASRVSGSQTALLRDPDDALLAAVIAKLFADRQTVPRAGVIPFLLPRIDRSFAAARAAVEALDRAALEEGRPVTTALASRVLGAPDDSA